MKPETTTRRPTPRRRVVAVLAAVLLVGACSSPTSPVADPKPTTSSTAPVVATSTTTAPTTTTSSSSTLPPTTSTTEATYSAASVGVHAPGWPWDPLADCESGDWRGDRSVVPGSARWADHDDPPYQGGVHFDAGTWDGFVADYFPGYPPDAHLASRDQQIDVAEKVLERQGWRAWPVCSRKIGAR